LRDKEMRQAITSTPYHLISLSRFFGGKGHLTSIVTQNGNNGSEDDDHDEINEMGYL
jgi:hypothetical protein